MNRKRQVQTSIRRTKRTVLTALVQVRFRDGETLLLSKEPERRIGAIYVAGYGIECALKARLCTERRVDTLPPEFARHDLHRLAESTTAWVNLEKRRDWHDAFVYLCSEWDVSMRYAMYPYDSTRVRKFIEKAKEFTKWLSEN